jgi:hypothetical protein
VLKLSLFRPGQFFVQTPYGLSLEASLRDPTVGSRLVSGWTCYRSRVLAARKQRWARTATGADRSLCRSGQKVMPRPTPPHPRQTPHHTRVVARLHAIVSRAQERRTRPSATFALNPTPRASLPIPVPPDRRLMSLPSLSGPAGSGSTCVSPSGSPCASHASESRSVCPVTTSL